MFAACLEVLGMILSVAGWLLVMIACGLPTWKVNAFIEGNIVVAQTIWEGLWMSCVVQSTGHMQCKIHDSVLALAQDLQTARALTVISAVLGVVGLTVTVAGAQCTNCLKDETVKRRVVYAGGVIYILCGLFVLVPLCWMANNIITDFHNPKVPPAQKREIGASIYIGWAAAALLLSGGTLLCCSFSRGARSPFPIKLAPTKTITASGEFDKKHYV
ncbi:claudin-5b [Poecilia latipinna]|uniref:Claudin n=3 Tax=Poecilia TaxID=8080 RepID=A0A087YSA5_POEFO|nr:PREDICTED: claudin-5-like [Poecilia formosa]XP_014856150.1 PREDICTED: claudin-5-like [Poecilia mexicana]XP_014905563.1 PREDICTED: claudin-5-like [Poecilia latipinna]